MTYSQLVTHICMGSFLVFSEKWKKQKIITLLLSTLSIEIDDRESIRLRVGPGVCGNRLTTHPGRLNKLSGHNIAKYAYTHKPYSWKTLHSLNHPFNGYRNNIFASICLPWGLGRSINGRLSQACIPIVSYCLLYYIPCFGDQYVTFWWCIT